MHLSVHLSETEFSPIQDKEIESRTKSRDMFESHEVSHEALSDKERKLVMSLALSLVEADGSTFCSLQETVSPDRWDLIMHHVREYADAMQSAPTAVAADSSSENAANQARMTVRHTTSEETLAILASPEDSQDEGLLSPLSHEAFKFEVRKFSEYIVLQRFCINSLKKAIESIRRHRGM